jgi:hypothetical protein
MVLEDHAPSVTGGAELVEDPEDGAVLEDGDDDAVTVVVVDDTRLVVDSDVLGAGAACTGGRSLTWASAALTICQVKPVARAATITQAPAMAHLLMHPLSQPPGVGPLNETSRFPQGGEPFPDPGITCRNGPGRVGGRRRRDPTPRR